MRSSAVTTIAALLLGLAGTPALAQFLPLPRTQQPPPLPPVEVEDEAPPYEPPPGYRRVPNPQYGRGYPQDVESNQLPPPSGYREPPVPGYEPIDPGSRVGRSYGDQQPGYQQGYQQPGYEPDPRGRYGRPPDQPGYQPGYQQGYQQPGYEPDPRGRYGRPADQPGYQPGYQQGYQQPGYEPDPRSRYGNTEPPPAYEPEPPRQGLLPSPLDILRPPAPVGRTQEGPQQGGVYAALPPEDRPETGPTKELPPHLRRTVINYQTREPVGTIIIDTPNTYLYLVMPGGKAMRYGIGVGREGFTWAGAEKVTRMAEWPDWHPPAEMIERQPYLPRFMAGGEGNPLGARALYLGKTLYRIHGTNQPSTIGTFVSSGCIRLTNDDVSDLYQQVKVGTRVVVLPGRPPASANAAPDQPSGPYNPLAPPRTR
jgi:lipoprotein-anchoring transpeptidase ErfK/SrfK